jgi:hypothetical protein
MSLGNPAVAGEAGELGGGALAAAAGVEDRARGGIAGSGRVRQRVREQLGAQVIGHPITDSAPGGDIDDGGSG